MKKLRGVLFSLAIIALTFTLAACGSKGGSSNGESSFKSELKNKGELTIGLEGTYAPYSYRKDGKLTGFEVEMGRALAKEMGLKAKFVPGKWDSLIAGLGSQKYDVVINNISETPERKKAYDFSAPYIYSRFALITPDKSSLSSLKDISGKKFAEGTGTNNERVAKKYKADTVDSGDFSATLSLIRNGRVDGTLNSAEAWYSYQKNNSTKGLKFKDVSNEEKPVKIKAMFNKKSPQTRKQFNKAIQALRKDGTLKKLSVKYFGKDITEKDK